MKTPEQWIADYLDGTLDDAGQMTLAAWLREKPENMRAFVDCNRFDQQVRQSVLARAQREAAECFQQDTGEARTSLEAITGRPQTGKPSHRFLAVSAMAAAVALGFFVWHQSGSVIPGGSSSPGPIARVTFLNGTQSTAGGPGFTIGQALAPGRLILGTGAMELKMENGVNIVFEGPGELQLIDPMHAALHSGQAVVEVPPNAIGFHLETPAAEIVDLGTEFAAKVGPDLSTDVQVFNGIVVTTPKGSSTSGFPQQVTAGNAVRIDPGSQSEPTPLAYAPERFLRSLSVTPPIIHDKAPSEHFNSQSHEEIESLPVTSAPVIDGDLSDWTDAGTFRGQREGEDGGNYYLEGRLRYDKDFLYFAARIGDPYPLRNIIRPDSDPEFAWRGGAVQIRLASDADLGWPVEGNAPAYFRFRKITADAAQIARASDERFAHLTMWHHAPSERDCLYLEYGLDYHGGVANPPGYHGSMRLTDDGTGYTLEYAIPWQLLNAPRAPQPGDILPMTWTVHWSDQTGRAWHSQLNEVRNPAEPARIYSWERSATWGRAVFR